MCASPAIATRRERGLFSQRVNELVLRSVIGGLFGSGSWGVYPSGLGRSPGGVTSRVRFEVRTRTGTPAAPRVELAEGTAVALAGVRRVGAWLLRPAPEEPAVDSPRVRPAAHNQGMKSRVHPKYKTKYHVRNWASYERALIQRGDLTVWLSPDAVAAWEPATGGRRGGQRKYSDIAIETALTVRLIFHLPLRQAEGFLTSVFGLMRLDLRVPDHTTLSRRGQHLDVALCHAPREKRLHLPHRIARDCRSSARGNGPRRNTVVTASAAGRSSISRSIRRV